MRTWLPYSFIVMFFAMPISGGVVKVADTVKFWAESGITKELVQAHISNTKCFASNELLQACRNAVADAKAELTDSDLKWVDDDFDSVIDSVDQISQGDHSKQWLLGLMLNSFIRTFDGHASLSPAAAFDSAIGPDADIHYGVGVRLMPTDAGLLIRVVQANSPAEAAGLKPFDKIVGINGHTVGIGLQAQKDGEEINGRPGDVNELSIERGELHKTVKVAVGVVSDKNIEMDMFSFNGKRYAVIRIAQFKEETCMSLKSAIQKLPKSVAGLMLDVRDNPGGILEEGVCVAGLFVGKKNIVGQKSVPVSIPFEVDYRPTIDGIIRWQPSYRSAEFPKLPLIVLVNQNSASAAEIVTGALQDHKQAWVVGERTFGKGSVQTLEPLPGDNRFYIGYTMALFYRPNGNTNQLAGVTPNFVVPMRRLAGPQERRMPREPDIFTNSLKPLEANTIWFETRPEATALRNCVESSANDLTAGHMIVKKTGSEDYQIAYALGVFDCSGQSTAQHNSSKQKFALKKK